MKSRDSSSSSRPHEGSVPGVLRLHSNFFRDYDPQTGRYLEADPIGQAGGLNRYLYPQNPLSHIDPSGLDIADWWGWGFPSPDEHFNRNRNNVCPAKAPADCERWERDPDWYAPNKFRNAAGDECAYNVAGDLLPDTTTDQGTQNYSFNYAPGRGNFYSEFTPKHFWQDILPHIWYGDDDGHYGEGLTRVVDDCGCGTE